MELTTIWFTLIAVLWIGYFVLEGFDFGVGMLLPVLAKNEAEKRVMINTIGPVWDGNEVWLLVAGGATFAAFPMWYATLFSGFYLPLFIILVALIVRGVAFEYRSKLDGAIWRSRWDKALTISSYVPSLLWGVAFANIVKGVPINGDMQYTGGFFNLLNPYALLGGITTLLLFMTHGAIFIALKTTGDLRARARSLAGKLAIIEVAGGGIFLLWTQLDHGKSITWITTLVTAGALIAALFANAQGREGWSFFYHALGILMAVATLFLGLFPNVMPSSTDPAFSLTVANASSTPYTLTIMTWVAVIFTPVVLAYQAWTYWVFRKRLGVGQIPALLTPNKDGSWRKTPVR